MHLVLWDIDSTLVDAVGLGRDAFLDAFARVTGRAPDGLVPFAGRTDLEIALDMLEAAGIDQPERLLDAFADALADAMAEREPVLRERGRALPGAAAAIEALAAEPRVVQSLLTGNIAANAHLKLRPFGLDRRLDLDIGAYGSDHRRRGELVGIARRRASRKLGAEVPASGVVLLGDTPLDVAAARAGGARSVGVASGPFDEGELEEAGADAVLADLTDVDAVRGAVLG